MKVIYQEHDIATVIHYWAKDFTGVKDGKVRVGDWFLDASKGKVVFKLYVDDSSPNNEGDSRVVTRKGISTTS